MANRFKVESHPQRMKIERDIVGGVPDDTIAKNYEGLTESSVRRYRKERMPDMLARADLETVEGIIRKINQNMMAVDKLYRSISDFLSDPDDPDEITFSPHASEITVVWEEYKEGKTIRRKTPLQNLLSKVPGTVEKVFTSTQDPRVTMLKTAEVLNKQLELLAKTKGIIQDKQEVNVQMTQTDGDVHDIVEIARKALEPWPEAMQAFIDALLEEAKC